NQTTTQSSSSGTAPMSRPNLHVNGQQTAATPNTTTPSDPADTQSPGVADLTTMTTSPQLQHLSFVNFGNQPENHDAGSSVKSQTSERILGDTTTSDAAPTSEIERPDSSLSEGSTGTVMRADTATGQRADVQTPSGQSRHSTGT